MRSIPLVLLLTFCSIQPAFTKEALTPRTTLLTISVIVKCSAEYLLLSDDDNRQLLYDLFDGYVKKGLISWDQITNYFGDADIIYNSTNKYLSEVGGCRKVLPGAKKIIKKWKKYRGTESPDTFLPRYTL